MTFHIITIFPDIFNSYFNESILNRAQKNNLIKIQIHNLRDWAEDKHKKVDDTPYGGGAGMVMKADVIYRAINEIKKIAPSPYEGEGEGEVNNKVKSKIILFSAKGKTWNQALAKKYSKLDKVIMICGRYEGIDERVKKFVDEEISIGDYVLTGGEIPAMVVVDSISRLIADVLGNKESLKEESFNKNSSLEYPQYTRPEVLEIKGKKYNVPKVLLSEDWQKKLSKLK
jgi:tRNA (guanine37-N1)-methyltransferase